MEFKSIKCVAIQRDRSKKGSRSGSLIRLDCDGLKVSCPTAWRSDLIVGQQYTVTAKLRATGDCYIADFNHAPRAL